MEKIWSQCSLIVVCDGSVYSCRRHFLSSSCVCFLSRYAVFKMNIFMLFVRSQVFANDVRPVKFNAIQNLARFNYFGNFWPLTNVKLCNKKFKNYKAIIRKRRYMVSGAIQSIVKIKIHTNGFEKANSNRTAHMNIGLRKTRRDGIWLATHGRINHLS